LPELTGEGIAVNDSELMRARIEAQFRHDERSRIVSINQWNGGVAPRFYLGRTPGGTVCRFRDDVPDDLADQLLTLGNDEPLSNSFARMPSHHEEYLRLLSTHDPVQRVWSGPGYCFREDVTPTRQPVVIDEENADLLRGGLEDWLPDVAHRQPFMAMIEDGHAVSVCASSRITDCAHEAGVETLLDYRRKGYAVDVVAGWASAVLRLGAVAFYSTSWDNVASRNVAARLGLSALGSDFHIT
jgi:hypothetical protein